MSEFANGFQISIFGKSAHRNHFRFENINERIEHFYQASLLFQTFKMGKYSVDVHWKLSRSTVFDEDLTCIYTGIVNISGKEVSLFQFTTIQSSSIFRLSVKFRSECSTDCPFEDAIQNTSVRVSNIKFSKKRSSRSNKGNYDHSILNVDQFHVLSKFQRKGYGAKVMALIFVWTKLTQPLIRKCVVIAPSSIGIPFYMALGAKRQKTSLNLEFDIY
jgi:hypothetical protein